jgi:hypothetical protein
MTWVLAIAAWALVMLLALGLCRAADEDRLPTPKPPYRGRL